MWQYRWWAWVLLFAAALIIQTSFLPLLFPTGFVPNLVLVVVALAFFESPSRGALLGAIAGLMTDMVAGRLIGMNLAIDAAAGYLVARLQSQIVRDDVLVPGVVGAFAAGAARLVEWGVLRLLGFSFAFRPFVAPLPTDILFALFMTGAVMGLARLRPRHEVDASLRF